MESEKDPAAHQPEPEAAPLEDPYDKTLADSFPASDPPPSTLEIGSKESSKEHNPTGS